MKVIFFSLSMTDNFENSNDEDIEQTSESTSYEAHSGEVGSENHFTPIVENGNNENGFE